MTRGTKYFLSALIGAVAGWVAGTMLVGFAEIAHFTDHGPVDMLNARAVSAALRDPSFTATMRWGDFMLTGTHWASSLPLLIALLAFLSVLFIAWMRRRKYAN